MLRTRQSETVRVVRRLTRLDRGTGSDGGSTI